MPETGAWKYFYPSPSHFQGALILYTGYAADQRQPVPYRLLRLHRAAPEIQYLPAYRASAHSGQKIPVRIFLSLRFFHSYCAYNQPPRRHRTPLESSPLYAPMPHVHLRKRHRPESPGVPSFAVPGTRRFPIRSTPPALC